jgi:hypothetical protein
MGAPEKQQKTGGQRNHSLTLTHSSYFTSFFFLTLADLPCCVSGKWVPKNQKVTKDPPYPGEA